MMGRIGLMSLICLMGICGCSRSQPATFYLMTAAAQSAEAAMPTSPTSKAIGVGPIDFPPYLDRAQMVIRKEDNTLILSEYNRWAEPLGASFQDILVQDLSRILSGNRVVDYPATRMGDLGYRVQVKVSRFDAGPDNNAHLEAKWDVFPASSSAPVSSRNSSLMQPCKFKDYKGLAVALSKLVADLSQEISKDLSTLP